MSDPADSAVFAAFAASVQKAARSGSWSLGVKLARAESVAVESRDAREIVARVKAPGRAVAPTVVLYPADSEWECDCPSRVSPCEHVIAAVIVLNQASDAPAEGTAAAEAAGTPRAAIPVASWGRVVYRFSRAADGLRLTRAIVYPDGRVVSIDTTLSAILSRPQEAATISPEDADLQADRLLESGARATLPPSKLAALMAVLAGTPRVLLDGRPIAIADDPILPRATITDRGDDIVVSIVRDPRIVDVVSPGVAVCAEDGTETLHALGEIELCGARLQNLPAVKAYPPPQLGTLATTVLPDLMRRLPVDVRSGRLPRLVRDVPPRLVLELTRLDAALSVLPTLVYGAPALARIDDGKLVSLSATVPLRDLDAERSLLHKLRADLDLLPGRRAMYQGQDALRFAGKLRQWRGDLTGDGAQLVTSQRRLQANLRVNAAVADGTPPQVGFDLTFTVVSDGGDGAAGDAPGATVDASSVMRAWKDGLGLVPLTGGGWAELPHAWLEQHGARLGLLLAARDEAGRLANHALPDLRALCVDLDTPPPPALDHLTPLIEGFDRLPEPELPGDLTATLRPYQRQGVAWLTFLRRAGVGGILADDMGLGKTLQALCVAGPGTLVVCPTSVLHNWAAEVRRFRPGLRVCLYHGPQRQLDAAADVTLTSYALLRLDRVALSAPRWRTVVLDEAQAIKNPDSQVARAAFGLPGELRLALSGTPVENRLDELWSLVNFTNRGLLGGRADFADQMAGPIALGDAAAGDRLRRRIRPFLLRRLKRDVAPELPPRTEAILHVELDDHERAVYDAVRAATRADIVALMNQGGQGGNVMKALEALLRLRQASCHAGLIPGQVAARSSKVDSLVGALTDAAADGHKALVFSQWTSLLDLIEPHLQQAGIAFVRLDGSTRDRGAVTAAFQAADGPPVMLISLKAGGSGLNLTAADHVFLCDPWWNPAVENQAADRAHRIGQERPVMIYRLVAMNTVEEKIIDLQQQKRALANIALDEGAAAAALTRDDLLALLA